jgi:hypothetical protein
MESRAAHGPPPPGAARRLGLRPTLSLALIFPLTIFGAAAQDVRYLDAVFTETTRWLLLALLALFLLWRGRLFLAPRSQAGPYIVAWLGWVCLTTLWSDLPVLSGLKSAALIVSVVSLVSGGIYWARFTRPSNLLSYLAPLTALALFATLGGLDAFRLSRGQVLFRGLFTGSENGLAILIAACLAYPLYGVCRPRTGRAAWPLRTFWALVAVALLAVLAATRSRGGALAALVVLAAFGFAVLPRKVFVVGAALTLLAGAVTVGALTMGRLPAGGIAGQAAQFIGKGDMRGDVLQSRRAAWQSTYEGAVAGGFIGVGEGVSAGSGKTFSGGVSAASYGRIKGDSPLAMVEETGLIGLALFAAILWRLFSLMRPRALAGPAGNERTQMILLGGALCGLLAQSVVESWWTSPASIESVVFWSTAGVAIGLARCPQAEPALSRHAAAARELGVLAA